MMVIEPMPTYPTLFWNSFVPHVRSTPSPLVGEGWGGGYLAKSDIGATPTPNPSLQGSGEHSGASGHGSGSIRNSASHTRRGA